MAELKFTKHFKKNLTQELNCYFENNEWPLNATSEKRKNSIYGRNYIDIGIAYKEDDVEHPNYLVGIEIETISSVKQININIDKFRNWTFNSKSRQGGLLHLIHASANVNVPAVRDIIKRTSYDISKGNGFHYELMVINSDFRETRQIVGCLMKNWEFNARLLSLIDRVFPDTF